MGLLTRPQALNEARMRRLLRRLAIGLGVCLLILLAAGYGVYRAATSLPDEYAAILQADTTQQELARQELESQLAAIYSDTQQDDDQQQPAGWEAWVTDDQINAWLATRLVQEMPSLANDGVVDPRVLFAEECLTLAFKLDQGSLTAVVLFRVAPFLAEDGRLGIELLETYVGTVPLPTGRVVEVSRPLFEESGLPVEWSNIEGRPALMVEFEKLASEPRLRRKLTAIEVGDGQLYVSGETDQRDPRLAMLATPVVTEE